MTKTIEELRQHISAVVDYNWSTEYADALENGPEGHIIEHLAALADFIGEPMSTEERARLYQRDDAELSRVTIVVETDQPRMEYELTVGEVWPVTSIVFAGPGDLVQHEESEGA